MTTKSQGAPVVFGQESLDALTSAAQASARRRKNLDFHSGPAHPAQRLLNAVEPDSYVQPHRHAAPQKDETLLVVRGAFGLVLFDENGAVSRTAVLRAHGAHIGTNIPCGTFHSLVSLESGSVFFEAKAGPYDATSEKEPAPWAPAEGDDGAREYHARLRALFQR